MPETNWQYVHDNATEPVRRPDGQPAFTERPAPKRAKYRNRKVRVGRLSFDSRKEARRWVTLSMWRDAGIITGLRRQVRYRLEVNGVPVCAYVADFVYWLVHDNREVVEDVKGFRTPLYKLKRKLMAACHGIEVVEV